MYFIGLGVELNSIATAYHLQSPGFHSLVSIQKSILHGIVSIYSCPLLPSFKEGVYELDPSPS
jgi:hypothetical protein